MRLAWALMSTVCLALAACAGAPTKKKEAPVERPVNLAERNADFRYC